MKLRFLISSLIIFNFVLLNNVEAQQKYKKIYIKEISSDSGVKNKIAERIRDQIALSIFAKYNNLYYVINDSDIKKMYEHAELLMIQSDDQSLIAQMANAINADEIIYGKLYSENGKLRLLCTNLERNRSTLNLVTKSTFEVTFFENQVDWYSSEASHKLIDFKYEINEKNIPVIDEAIKIDIINTAIINGTELKIINFSTNDNTIAQIIEYLKEQIEKGDIYYNQRKLNDARSQYESVLNRIENKLSLDNQKKMSKFTSEVKQRINLCIAIEYKNKIDSIDTTLLKNKTSDESSIIKYKKKYENILLNIEKERQDYTYVIEFKNVLHQRIDKLYSAIASQRERIADSAYHEYRFEEALLNYKSIINIINNIYDPNIKNGIYKNIVKKISYTHKTGEGYLFSRVMTLTDQAQLLNVKDQASNMKKVMRKAREQIEESRFSTSSIIKRYNAVAAATDVNEIDENPEKANKTFDGDIAKNYKKDLESDNAYAYGCLACTPPGFIVMSVRSVAAFFDYHLGVDDLTKIRWKFDMDKSMIYNDYVSYINKLKQDGFDGTKNKQGDYTYDELYEMAEYFVNNKKN